MIAKAEKYAIECHDSTNHRYNGKPYSVHLVRVVEIAETFINLIPQDDRENVIAACWVHDVIEDCRQTYNEVKAALNEEIAELAYALTNEKGRNRAARANDKYYEGIRAIPHAAFVKICDRIANYQYSKETKSSMTAMYEKEHAGFVKQLYAVAYKEMFDYLEACIADGK